jgi:hypothetical protein
LTSRVNARARTREDRAGDPLDGLVNLFDLGIVLAVAFLLAALSSIDLAPSVLQQNTASKAQQVPADSVIVKPGEESNPIELQPGEKVVGQGEQVGTVYKLDDGRTVIVRPENEAPVPGEDAPESDSPSSTPGTSTTPESTLGDEVPTTPTVPPPSTGSP